ncbi:MutT/nudix family transporter protein [Legionella busanensis]|uniref:MutT/nudix family transporter protein n=1 Tax=Legionella busanensis TaxID=190655 RepID=A0A378JKK2_9GAMM|nr:CoA pyrophosphatase [Legionella busanensis]STX51704.1 MutT/nudix family transporter protein [Legionella busanensis]
MQRRNAAVLVLHEKLTNSIILTERSSQLKNHPGEICFPGGLWEEEDETLFATALRELQEELGITADRVKLIKSLAPEQTLTGYLIYPWLASIETIEPYEFSEEVTDILRIPIDSVCNINHYQKIEVERRGFKIISYQFTEETRFVWGATVRIMMQLCESKNKYSLV